MHIITSSLKGSLIILTALFGVCLPPAIAGKAIASRPTTLASLSLSDYDNISATQASSADDYYNRGIYFQGQGHLEAAIHQFNQAIALNANNPDYYFSRGLTQTDNGNHQAAQRDYSKSLEIDPTFAAAYYQRGLSRIVVPVAGVTNFTRPSLAVEQRDDFQLAIADFSKALEYSPEFVAAHYYRGLSHYVMGNESLAWHDYQQARRLNPLIAESFYRQGFTQLYIGSGPEHPN